MHIRRSLTVFCVVPSVCGWGNGVLHKLQSFMSNLYSHWLLSVGHSSFVAEEASGSLHAARSYGCPATCDVDRCYTHLLLFAVHLPGDDSENRIFKSSTGTSLMAQWLRICLLMQGTWVRALVREDPTCRGAAEPARHNYWACALEPVLRNRRSHGNEKPMHFNEE